jgi:hypothetical protein
MPLLLLAGRNGNIPLRKKVGKAVFVICIPHDYCRVHGNANDNDGLAL